MATHVETGFLDDAERRYAEDLARLRLLLEASSRLLGSWSYLIDLTAISSPNHLACSWASE